MSATTSSGAPWTRDASLNHGNNQYSLYTKNQTRVTPDEHTLDPMLELRLMHEWNTQVPQSFSTAWEFWQRQAPLIAFQHRYVLDSLFCLAALHAHRRQPQQWLALESRMAPTAGEQTSTGMSRPANDQGALKPWNLPSEMNTPEALDGTSRLRLDDLALEQQRGEMLRVARIYFDRALAGQNRALPAIDAASGEACYLASLCVTWAGLFFLGADQDAANPGLSDPIQWVRVAQGSRVVVSSRSKLSPAPCETRRYLPMLPHTHIQHHQPQQQPKTTLNNTHRSTTGPPSPAGPPSTPQAS